MYFLKQHKFAFSIFLLAFSVRLLYLGFALSANEWKLHEPISGADCYFVISINLLHGNGYSCNLVPPYTLNSIRPPVEPYFLASLYAPLGTYWLPLVVQIALGSLVPLLGMAIAGYMTKRRKIIMCVGILLALEPTGVLFSIIFYSETIFTVLLLSAIVCLFRYLQDAQRSYLWASGILLGLATLTKPTSEYLPVLFALCVLWYFRANLRATLLPLTVFLALFIATLSPWVLRNYYTFGVAGVSPQLGEQLYVVLVPSVLSFEKGTTFQQEFDAILASGGVDPSSASIEHGREYFNKAVPILLAHPKSLSIISANTGLNFFIHDGMIEVLKHVGERPPEKLGKPALFLFLTDPGRLLGYIKMVFFTPIILILVGRIAWILITLFAVVGAVRYVRSEAQTIYGIVSVATIFYFMLTTLVIGLAVTARYRLPVNALVLIFAVYGGAYLFNTYKHYVTRWTT